MSDMINVAVVGCGYWGPNLVRNFSSVDGVKVAAVADLSEERLAHVQTAMTLSIIGCVVNGPGEARETDIGFTGGGAGSGMVYVAGRQDHKLANEAMIDHIVGLVEKRAAELEAANS